MYDTGLMGEAWLCDSFVFERDREGERERRGGGETAELFKIMYDTVLMG